MAKKKFFLNVFFFFGMVFWLARFEQCFLKNCQIFLWGSKMYQKMWVYSQIWLNLSCGQWLVWLHKKNWKKKKKKKVID
jgi:hypothetical protein